VHFAVFASEGRIEHIEIQSMVNPKSRRFISATAAVCIPCTNTTLISLNPLAKVNKQK
jgi:hypothetical protein